MDSLENTVPIILTWHFEASECAENTNKSHELNSLVALPASIKWITKEEMLPLSATGFIFSLKERNQQLELKAENVEFSGFKEKIGLSLRKAVGNHHGYYEGLQCGHRGFLLTTTHTRDLQLHPTSTYFFGYEESHSNWLRCKYLYFKLQSWVRDP